MAARGTKRARKVAMGVAAAGVAATVAGVAATSPASISAVSASMVDLTALIVVGSSTNPSGAGVEDFFEGKFDDPVYTGPTGEDVSYVNFITGPLGIAAALAANAGESNAVLASGWGAANASLLLLANHPDLSRTVVILDNDVSRPDGGFGTRYPWFALIGVNPVPTPDLTGALAVVNTGYQYDYNSNAPADVLNPIAAVNSLVAYLNTRLNQSERVLPVNVDGTPAVTCNANTCAITLSGAVLDCADARCTSPADRITAYVTTRGNTTYVTYTTDELPLTKLIRNVFGDRIADISDPLLRLAVDSAYYGGNPIPKDPSAYRPARILPSPAEVLATVAKIPAAIQQSLAAAKSSPQTGTAPTTAGVAATLEQPAESGEFSDDLITDTADDLVKPQQRNVLRKSEKAQPGQIRGEDGGTGQPSPDGYDDPDLDPAAPTGTETEVSNPADAHPGETGPGSADPGDAESSAAA
ncbi:PE-PPE domain-containing protein [Mycolicibacterium sp. XJ1819]